MSLAGFRRLLEAALAHHVRGNPYAGERRAHGRGTPISRGEARVSRQLRRSRPQDRTAPAAFPFSCVIKESRRPRTPGSVIVKRARKVIVVADSTKLGRRGFAPIAQSTLSRPWSPTREPTLPNSKPYADKGSICSPCSFPDGPETWEIRVVLDEFLQPAPTRRRRGPARLRAGGPRHSGRSTPRPRPCRPRRWPAVRRCVSEVRRWATQAASRTRRPRLQQRGWPDRRLVAEADWPRTSSRVRVQGAHAATQSWAGVDVMRTGRHPTRPSGGWQSDHLPPD